MQVDSGMLHNNFGLNEIVFSVLFMLKFVLRLFHNQGLLFHNKSNDFAIPGINIFQAHYFI